MMCRQDFRVSIQLHLMKENKSEKNGGNNTLILGK